jgi:hypothetical protein
VQVPLLHEVVDLGDELLAISALVGHRREAVLWVGRRKRRGGVKSI